MNWKGTGESMDKQKQECFVAFLKERVEVCKQEEKKLLADGRKDEANFEKIRGNIYEVFQTVFGVAVRTEGEKVDGIERFFQNRIETIPAGWRQSYEKAMQHDDAVKMQIETIKLDVVEEIKEMFEQIFQGEVA